MGARVRTTEEIARYCEDIVLDTYHKTVEAWRERTGKQAVGFLPVYAPRELIRAADMLPVGVVGGGDQMEIIRGDAYYQSYICQIPRSVIEMGLTKRLDCLAGMIFPATCDVIRNLSGMWQVLFPGKMVHYLDVPHNHDPAVGGKFYAHELRRLAAKLTGVSGVEITDAALRESIELYNENCAAVDALYDLRAESPERVPTGDLYVLVRVGYQLPVEEHTALLREYMEAAKDVEARELDQARVVVIGTFCEQPPLGLIRTLERAGCFIVDDDLLIGARFVNGPIPTDGDLFEALAMAWIKQGRNTPSRYVPDEDKGRYVIDMCKKRKAEGVIFCAPSFCDPALLEQPMLQDALDREGIPYTTFKFAENTGQFHAIREQSGTFADSIMLWSEAS